MKDYNYNDGVWDTLFPGAAERRESRRERKESELNIDQTKADALLATANKPASSNKALIIIPIAVVTIGGIIAIILTRKKGK
jgi:hypothetical protein